MKHTVFLMAVLAVVLAAGCRNHSAEQTEGNQDTSYTEEISSTPSFDKVFPSLYQYLHNQDSSFQPSLFEEGAILEKPDSAALPGNMDELKTYSPYFIYNQDSSMALDLVSYNYLLRTVNGKTEMVEQGPDYEAGLIDLQKKKRKQLLFFGTSGVVLDAKWLDKETLMMAGASEWEGENKLRIDLYRYSAKDQTIQKFPYPKAIKANWSKYPQPWTSRPESFGKRSRISLKGSYIHPFFRNIHNIQIGISNMREVAR